MGGGDLSSVVRMGEIDTGAATMTSLQQQPLVQNQNQNRSCNSDTVNSGSVNNARGASFGRPDPPADEFPVGMKVLVVDDDPTCLTVLERMLRRCSYRVTTCGRATDALSLLREDISKFDLVISDVYMPDMDGFKLLETVGLEMDLPVIMMSGNGETSAVMKGITHGACDYLLKPVRIEELRNIWQHVVRKKRQETKDVGQSKSLDEGGDRLKRGGAEDVDYTSSVTEPIDGIWRLAKRRKESKEEEEDLELENEDPSTTKKPRVVWSVELHQQFVSAVHQLGIDKAVPKRILELMGVHGLTRENVASHLQKYRLYLRRISGVTSQHSNMSSQFGGPDPFSMISQESIGMNLATGQLTPQALAQFHMLSRMNSTNGMGLSNSLDPGLGQFLMQDLPRSHVGGMLKSSTGLLPSLTSGLHLDQLPETHHHPSMDDLDDLSCNSKVFPQINGANDVSYGGSSGNSSGNLASNNNSEALLMQIFHSRAPQQGSGSSSNLPQPRGGVGPPHLMSNDINFSRVGSLPNLVGNLGSAVGLSAMSGSAKRKLPSLLGGIGTPPSNPLGSTISHVPIGEEPPNLINSAAGTFSMASSVQSPKPGGGPGPSINERLNQQQSMWTPYNTPSHQSQGYMQRLSEDSLPTWLGSTDNLGIGDLGQSISLGINPQFPPHSPNYGVGFALASSGSYISQNVNFPVSLALEGGTGRSSYEP